MDKLNAKKYCEQQDVRPELLTIPEKVIQFGEGNFLRAFADWMLHQLNKNDRFGGRVVLVQPIADGLAKQVNEQDGLYTLLLRGLQDGKPVVEKEIITSVSRCINPYENWKEVLKCAEKAEIEFIISNTTEAGIVYDWQDSIAKLPPTSFPGKVTAFLYHRFKRFSGSRSRGMVILPCELIDRNGDKLKEIVIRLANEWGLSDRFVEWIEQHNYFLNTLVDRVVTGFPKDEIGQLTEELGYEDQLLDTGELFHLWVIEGPKELEQRLPFAELGMNVIWTEDMTPYRTRKVRILNGAHTASVPVAFLAGLETVGEMMEHEVLGKFVRETIYDEIVPSIKGMDAKMLVEYADAVVERFRNPYIKHYLISILLNSSSKFKTRDLPSILEYYEQFNTYPERLTFALAGLLSVYKDGKIEGANMLATREKGEFTMKDDLQALTFLADAWQQYEGTNASAISVAKEILGSGQLWDQDLNDLPGFTEKVGNYMYRIHVEGITSVITSLVK